MKHVKLFENFAGRTTLKPIDISRPGDVVVFLRGEVFATGLISQEQFRILEDCLEESGKPRGKSEYGYDLNTTLVDFEQQPGIAYVYHLYRPSFGDIEFWTEGADFEDETVNVMHWATGANPNYIDFDEEKIDTVIPLKRGMLQYIDNHLQVVEMTFDEFIDSFFS
jgi:hypothetical protein